MEKENKICAELGYVLIAQTSLFHTLTTLSLRRRNSFREAGTKFLFPLI